MTTSTSATIATVMMVLSTMVLVLGRPHRHRPDARAKSERAVARVCSRAGG